MNRISLRKKKRREVAELELLSCSSSQIMWATPFWKVDNWEKIKKEPLDLHRKLRYLGGGKDIHTSPSNRNSCFGKEKGIKEQ